MIANGQQSTVWDVPLAGSEPAIFALNAAGVGQGAILNQDNSINGPSNPAAPGSVIQIFATGEGIAMRARVTGSITTKNLTEPDLPIVLKVGDAQSPVGLTLAVK